MKHLSTYLTESSVPWWEKPPKPIKEIFDEEEESNEGYWKIVKKIDIDAKDGLSGNWAHTGGCIPINLRDVTAIYLVRKKNWESRGCSVKWYIMFECDGKFGGEYFVYRFFERFVNHAFSIRDYSKITELYNTAMDEYENWEDEKSIKWLKETDYTDIINKFDESNLGNRHGSFRCTGEELYYILIARGCFYGTTIQKNKYIKKERAITGKSNPGYTYFYWYEGAKATVAEFFGCKDHQIYDKAKYADIEDITDIYITDVKNVRNVKFFNEKLANAAFLYLVDIILHNDIRRCSGAVSEYISSDRSRSNEFSISLKNELTYDDLADWMKAFGLTKDKVRISGKRIYLNKNAFEKYN